jgi:signal transduction histidine kinase
MSAQECQGKLLKDVIADHHMLSIVSDREGKTPEHTPKQVKIFSPNPEIQDTIRESSIVIEDENGNSIGVVSSLHNVTAQKEIEKRKNDILDVLGHDLRAPLVAVKQNFSLLVDNERILSQLDDQQKKFLSLCKRNIERMEKLIFKILDVRQLETGKVILKKEEVDINKLLEESVLSLKPWANDKNISLNLVLEKMPCIQGDPERTYQVISNLVSNAIKFTPEGGNIEVKGKVVESNSNKFIEISVKDSGIGIKKEDLPRIFNKYEQVSLEHPMGSSGLGLGLAICKSIVELHGGRIWADSKIGEGSIFTFQLPASEKEGE